MMTATVTDRGTLTLRLRGSAGVRLTLSLAVIQRGGAKTLLAILSASVLATVKAAFALSGESVADNCQILQTRVNRFNSDKDKIEPTQLEGYSCDINFTNGELDIIEMAVHGDVMRPGNQCRCRTVAEMLGKVKSKDDTAACKLP